MSTISTSWARQPAGAVDPSYARKMLRDLVEWSRLLGFEPPRDFAAVERLSGRCRSADLRYGLRIRTRWQKRFTYRSHPNRDCLRRQVERMRDQLGLDGFHYIVAT